MHRSPTCWLRWCPVSYALIDTFAISRRFNAITTYVASTAIMNGVLAFWFVDGWQYALKDTAGLIVAAGLFFGSLLLGRPMFEFFAAQVFQPDTQQKERAFRALCTKPVVRQGLIAATVIVGTANLMLGVINFLLNLNIVLAPFGTESFNAQVAQVNAITRVLFPVVSLGCSPARSTWSIARSSASCPAKRARASLRASSGT